MSGFKNYWFYPVCFIVIIVFTRIVNFNGLYGQDAYEYVNYATQLKYFVKNTSHDGAYFWPLFYPFTGALLSTMFSLALALQLVSVCSLLLLTVYLEKTLQALYSEQKSAIRLYVLLFLMLSPYALRASMVVMSDCLCMFLLLAGFYHTLRYQQTMKNKHLVLLVLYAALACYTRYAAFVILVSPFLYITIGLIRKPQWKIIGIGALVAVPFLCLLLIFKQSQQGFIQHAWLQGWSVGNFIKNRFTTIDGTASYTVWNCLFGIFNLFYPGFCFMGLIFVIAGRKKIFESIKESIFFKMILAAVLIYACFLAGIPFQNQRFLLLSFPLVLILFYPGFMHLLSKIENKPKILKNALLYATIIIQLGLFGRAFRPFYHYNKLEQTISLAVLKISPESDLYTFSVDGALKYYGVKNKIVNLWSYRLDTMEITSPAFVLYNEQAFREQWKGKNPMLNWEFLKQQYQFTKLENLPDNWELYEIR